MMDEDLEKTKPITTLKDLEENEEEIEESLSRVEKNKDILEESLNKEKEEEAEEALAEKNIAMAEAIIEEENEDEDSEESEEDPEKVSIFTKIKDKWQSLDKKKKILFITIAVLVVVLIAALIVFLVVFLNKNRNDENPDNQTPSVEEPPVLADNFYYKDGTLHFLGADGNEVGTYECENKSASLCYVGFNKTDDTFDIPTLLDEKGQPKDQRYPIVDDAYAYVVDNKEEANAKIKLYSIKDNKVLKEYQSVKAYDDNYAIVATDKKYGLIKVEDGITSLIEEQYDYLGMINGENNLLAKYNKGYKIIDKNNKSLSGNFSSSYEITNYNDNFVVAKVSGVYTIYDYKATLLDKEYDYITIKDNYIFLVKDNNLYIKDKDKNKINEGNIKLKNKNYVKTFIYNDDGELAETKASFEINIPDKITIQIQVYDNDITNPETKTVNVAESLVNAKYEYVNYFDGMLYFYEDSTKEQLLGSYKCSNNNDVSSEDDDYTMCFIATDTVYEDNDMVKPEDMNRNSRVPIVNKRYVFIADGLNNIILYDLKANKSLVDNGYTTINSNTPNNDNKVTLYEGTLDVIALGKKGKYGMITIDEDKVIPKYQFNYNKMEKIGDYILTLDTTNKWKIHFDDSKESIGFDSKIRGYSENLNYFKVKVGDSYHIYDYNGTPVSSDNFAYVELYDTYYAGIDNNKELYIYNYYGSKINNTGIKVKDYPYCNTANPAFKVSQTGSDYIISIYNGTDYDKHLIDSSGVVSSPQPEEEQ